jgi:hypothetical protein
MNVWQDLPSGKVLVSVTLFAFYKKYLSVPPAKVKVSIDSISM